VKPFNVKNGTLYHEDVKAVTRVPRILLTFHDNPATGGHFGRDKNKRRSRLDIVGRNKDRY